MEKNSECNLAGIQAQCHERGQLRTNHIGASEPYWTSRGRAHVVIASQNTMSETKPEPAVLTRRARSIQ